MHLLPFDFFSSLSKISLSAENTLVSFQSSCYFYADCPNFLLIITFNSDSQLFSYSCFFFSSSTELFSILCFTKKKKNIVLNSKRSIPLYIRFYIRLKFFNAPLLIFADQEHFSAGPILSHLTHLLFPLAAFFALALVLLS